MEATSENNTASNHSSDDMDSMQKTEECSEKGSDALVWMFSYSCNYLIDGIFSLLESLNIIVTIHIKFLG